MLMGTLALVAVVCWLVVYMQGTRRVETGAQYVAVGSSFASGPGILPRSAGSPLLCARSDRNYAHLLARKRGLTLVDMSCAGATTGDVLIGGQYFQGAQLSAIDISTKLVTITIGGNDVQYLSNLVAKSCPRKRAIFNIVLRDCTPTPESEVGRHFMALESSLRAIASEVRRRSPQAHVVFVGYLNVLPPQGSCDLLGLSDDDVAALRGIAQRLKETTRSAAAMSGATYVDPNDPAVDHSVCSTVPWVNDRFPQGLLAAPFHPRPEGMQSVALAIDRSLGPAAL